MVGLWMALILAWSAAPAVVDNGHGHTWTPDGKYKAVKGFTRAEFDSTAGTGTLDGGNGCIMTGKITRVAKSPVWRFLATESDGQYCPTSGGERATITILDGPAVNAMGNASRIRVTHKAGKRDVSFAGVYTFVDD